MKYLFNSCLLIAAFSVLVSCSTQDHEQAELNYAEIPLLELEKEFSIAASDEYIPALITRVMVTQNGHILVTQRSDRTINQFDSLGNFVTQVAGPGRGPGELSEYANPHFNGEVLVMSNNNGMFTEYQPNDEGIYEYTTDYTFRPPGPMRGIRSDHDLSSFYIKVDSARTPFLTIPPEFTTDLIHLANVKDNTLQIEEGILSLKTHSVYVEITDGGTSMTYYYIPYRYTDHFTPLPDQKILVSRPNESLIQVYDENFEITHELHVNAKDRLLTEEDIEFHFPENSRTERRDRRELMKDIKPPFMGVMVDDQDHFWLYTDETEAGKEYVILDYEGNPIGRVLLPSAGTLQQVNDEKLYFVNREAETEIEVYSVVL